MIKSFIQLTMSNAIRNILLLTLGVFALASCQNNVANSKAPQVDPTKAILAYEIKAQLGEGAFWDHKTQTFYWVDIEGKKLHIFDPSNQTNQTINMPSRIGTVVPINTTEAMVALENGIHILWVGTMHMPQTSANGSVYKINADGSYQSMIDSVTISNGIVWTQDAKTMYYIDTPTGYVRAYDFDNAKGTISNERKVIEVPISEGFPDGMAIDNEDKLWIGLWNGNKVARYDPLTGKMMSSIDVPAHNVTACAFGGPELDTLYITTARVDMTDKELDSLPLSGSVFKAVPGVKGVVSSQFKKES